jgi:hypothetical protein
LQTLEGLLLASTIAREVHQNLGWHFSILLSVLWIEMLLWQSGRRPRARPPRPPPRRSKVNSTSEDGIILMLLQFKKVLGLPSIPSIGWPTPTHANQLMSTNN